MLKNSIIEDSDLKIYTASAKGIGFDTCHKIYVLMDNEQMELMREYEYEPLISSDQMTPEEMFDKVVEWYEDSCALRFISAVYTNKEDPNKGFIDIVPQGADWQEDDEEDED
jgi:hypothetical protein